MMISISIFSIEDDITTLYVVGLRITLTSVLLFLLSFRHFFVAISAEAWIVTAI